MSLRTRYTTHDDAVIDRLAAAGWSSNRIADVTGRSSGAAIRKHLEKRARAREAAKFTERPCMICRRGFPSLDPRRHRICEDCTEEIADVSTFAPDSP